MVRESIVLVINSPIQTGTDLAVLALARTLTLHLAQHQDPEAIRLWEGPSKDNVAGQEPRSKSCLYFSSRPPRRPISPHRVGLGDVLDILATAARFQGFGRKDSV